MVPFMLLNTRGHGEVRLCCTISGLNKGIPKNATLADTIDYNTYSSLDKFNLKRDAVVDFWNSKFMQDFRLRMLKGEYIENCKDCFRLEDKGLTSKRLSRNKVFFKSLKKEGVFEKCQTSDGYLDTMPRWWEVRLSTKCNVSCYMCSPVLSSKIYNEFMSNRIKIAKSDATRAEALVKFYGKDSAFLSESDFFKQQFFENINSITHFEMRGGEVLFDKKSVEFLNKVSLHPRAREMHFDLSTNGTILTETIIASLNRFKSGKIRFSIDGYGEENEYMRYPTKWPIVVKNLIKSKALKKDLIKLIQVTINVFQVYTVHKLLWHIDSFIKEQETNFFFSFSLVRDTPHLVHELVPLALRKKSADRVRDFLDKSYICNAHQQKDIHRQIVQGLVQTILSNTSPSDNAKELFFDKIPPLDEIRGQNYLKVFPHLKVLQD